MGGILLQTMPQIITSNIEGTSTNFHFTETPDECPQCRRGTNPRVVHAVMIGAFHEVGSQLRVIFQCTWVDCLEVFIGYYNLEPGTSYDLVATAPVKTKATEFPDSIPQISKDFVEIYNQAMAAEGYGLEQITGIGLRKALEFLIKDFLINQEPNKADEIKGKFLGKCIDGDVTDPNIKATAKRATWLGNDETHYVRKWEDKDINDLKVLIRLTVNWVDSAILTQQYIREMNP
jgi:hypothetical protein